MSYEQTQRSRKHYVRPANAKKYRTVESMLADPRPNLNKQRTIIPDAGIIRPNAFGTYTEASSEHNPVSDVVCSGAVLLMGSASNGGHYIGITDNDAAPGDEVTAYTEGKFYLPLDWAGDSGATPARVAASDKGSLAGKAAYWLKDLGLITDKLPASGGEDYLHVGEFYEDSAALKPEGIGWGHVHALVDVRPADLPANAVTAPSDGAISHVGSYAVFAEVSSFAGLTVDFFLKGFNSDPGVKIKPSDFSTVIDAAGTNDTKTEDIFSFTFASNGSYTVDVTIGGTTFNFSVTVNSAAVPTIARA